MIPAPEPDGTSCAPCQLCDPHFPPLSKEGSNSTHHPGCGDEQSYSGKARSLGEQELEIWPEAPLNK